jgi:3-oxoacyl-[acyl-carrier-protein] synthase III
MQCDGLYIAGLGHRLPGTVDVAKAVADGRYDPTEQAANQYVSVTVSDDQAPPEMAVEAARIALGRSGIETGRMALLLHASVRFQGLEFWPAAAYVHREVLGGVRHAPAVDVHQMCNGTAGAMEMAASYLLADPRREAALITTADTFAEPGFDRWRSDVSGTVYGDGAAAVVLARTGFARLRSICTVMDTDLEAVYRGDQPFTARPDRPVDVRTRRREFMTARGHGIADRTAAGLVEVVERTLADAGAKLSDIARFVFPNVGLGILCDCYLAPLGLDVPATTWEWGRHTGHVGAADQLIGLARLLEEGVRGPVMLIGIGAGFSWTCVVLEIDRTAP